MSTGPRHSADCEKSLSVLVAWYPTSTLSEEERGRVEAHTGSCEECAELLRLASGLRNAYRRLEHPDPETIVNYAENDGDLTAEEEAGVESHLGVCPLCAREVAILREIERPGPAAAAGRKTGRGPRFGRSWREWGGTLLRPAAAAAYLTVAVVSVLILLLQPGSGPRIPSLADPVQPVVVIPDASIAIRGLEPADIPLPEVDRRYPIRLLLELTGLEAPPRPQDRYRVVVNRDPSANPVWSVEAEGRVFRENYAFLLTIPPGALASGPCEIRVLDPHGNTVFRSGLRVR